MEKGGCIVTGGASGIGLATVEALVQRDEALFVVLADRDAAEGAKQAKRLAGSAARVLFVEADVSEDASIQALVQRAKAWLAEQGAPLRYLVNAAGCNFVVPFASPQADPGAIFDRAVAVNLRSVYLMCHHCTPLLAESAALPPAATGQSPTKRTRLGSTPSSSTASAILNVSSTQAARSYNDMAAYAATKGGINSLTSNLAGDLARKSIRVNSICPGAVKTSIEANSAKHERQPMFSDEPFAANMVTAEFLKGQEASLIGEAAVGLLLMRGVTGQHLVVDGGCSVLGFLDY